MKQRKGEEILLNIYDLMDNTYLYPIGLGAYHSGVQIYDREYTFSDGGVFNTQPKEVDAPLRTTISMGFFTGTYKEFEQILDEIKIQFQPGTYDLYSKNCNCFSNVLCQRLINKSIPGWINRMAGMGNTFQNLFGGSSNKQTQAPIQETRSGNYQTISSQQSTHQFQSTGQRVSDTPQTLPTNPEERRKMIVEQFKKNKQKK